MFRACVENVAFPPRDATRNTFLGITLTIPEPDAYVVGVAWEDSKDGRHDEDVYVVDPATATVKPYYQGRWELVDARYRGTHHGDKSYLNPASPSTPDADLDSG